MDYNIFNLIYCETLDNSSGQPKYLANTNSPNSLEKLFTVSIHNSLYSLLAIAST